MGADWPQFRVFSSYYYFFFAFVVAMTTWHLLFAMRKKKSRLDIEFNRVERRKKVRRFIKKIKRRHVHRFQLLFGWRPPTGLLCVPAVAN